jgi:hypothetical protein
MTAPQGDQKAAAEAQPATTAQMIETDFAAAPISRRRAPPALRWRSGTAG